MTESFSRLIPKLIFRFVDDTIGDNPISITIQIITLLPIPSHYKCCSVNGHFRSSKYSFLDFCEKIAKLGQNGLFLYLVNLMNSMSKF